MTPRPTTAPTQSSKSLDEATTPTRANFGAGTLSPQEPLPMSPYPKSPQAPESRAPTSKRARSEVSRTSTDSGDVDMVDSDGGRTADDGAVSDDASISGDGTKSKKKKPQRFYCTDYPPCALNFTRSEHLARHIRKHTGERPFQCHCTRRFSRLDNLRQHAQTVHANEDIPMDSLAATGTRFQRQIRTDRVRQPGRARASTAGSVGPAGRGHSKSLSTSSIASVSSIASGYSVNDTRRRPPPLVMADPRSRMSLESYRGTDGQYYRAPSPGDFSTPTSSTFSTGQNSPHWGAVMSPGTPHSRSHSMYAGSGIPSRRLSVPSSNNPFQSPHGPGARVPGFGPPAFNSSNAGAVSPSQNSLLSSPTPSTTTWSRRDSTSSAADEAWRRRTWHPDTRDYNGASRLSQVITPSQLPPDNVMPTGTSFQPRPVRLPGIESFDEMTRFPPPPRGFSPMTIDSDQVRPPPQYQGGEPGAENQRGHAPQWDMNLNRGLDRLEVDTPPRDSAGTWASEANQALSARAEQARVRFEPEAIAPTVPTSAAGITGPRHQHTMSAPSFNTHRESRRHGWYNGPVNAPSVGETIHEGRPHVDRIVHPNVSSFRGFPAREQEPASYVHQPGFQPERVERTERIERMERIPERIPERMTERPANQGEDPEALKRLEALVAVAASHGSVATY
ncbi:hypothetical protein B0I37DRAFT_312241 [Chaetomium sp. MPI-CAGE-AT-0009]|nr:hypothetical protein B0I37DRAFT_312241 [Chaetomium sp. MPI-CAGE-AT-0009]